ncbi:oxidoreductase [Pedobacter fastidiosus]|uniref:SDR family NAD(P)-dependent oxidoreductase n=1 Tax=Pedobacter fastidiosus TaxID=2765361 RepID=A0ABR7KXZ1_9SPHI|nr:oxidoreductase [Pedobacter fastidiosus]MBC6112998.1 SDR family NAD(P)-dependent oxidoreductase [Pedobacter fastidiosus]
MWTTKEIPDQKGRTVIVTGGNTGIGYETALALYQAGANVIVACRDKEKAKNAISKMENQKGSGSLEAGILDLASLNSVRLFSERFIEQHEELHLLINNAGVASPPASKTTEGYELQFGVNFIGHFALTGYLYSLLQATHSSRIITLSSNGYQNSTIDFDNLKSEKDYNALREYRQSKLANLIFSIELNRRIKIKGQQVLSIAAQPGANNTELTRHLSNEEIAIGKERLGAFMEPWQGALSSLYAAVSKDAIGGNMYEPDDSGLRGYPILADMQENAMDETVAKKLWKVAQEITGIVFPV